MELRLTPTAQLKLVQSDHAEADAIWVKSFQKDWRRGLFVLAAQKIDTQHSMNARYWREFAERFLTALCHIPETSEDWATILPTPAELSSLTLSAPPMQGGEYLSHESLLTLWDELEAWVQEEATNGLASFLEAEAPKWNKVGRVCFHLAENKKDETRPFAFLATYAAGMNAAGQIKYQPLGKALKEYAGTQNRDRLLKLLQPVYAASESVEWVKEFMDSGGIYKPMAWYPTQAYQLLRSVSALEASGLLVRLPDWWKKRASPRVSVTIDAKKASQVGFESMLNFDMQIALGDDTLTEAELRTLLSESDGLLWFKGQWVEVDQDKLQEAIDHWDGLRKEMQGGEISFVEGMRLLAGASNDLKDDDLSETTQHWSDIHPGEVLQELLEGLRNPGTLQELPIGHGLQATLRPYQKDGVAWMHTLTRLGLGACLADDMGLGKTIQILALLIHHQHNTPGDELRPSLLVVPASLLGNWKQEAEKFTPSLRLQFLHSSELSKKEIQTIAKAPDKFLESADLVVTTYGMTTRVKWLSEVDWNLVILDEAQAIKNPGTRQTKATKQLPAQARIVLTGTPVENRLGDLWSLFDFVNPGLLGTSTVFKRFVKQLEDRQTDQFAPLRHLVSPYILRRMKTDPKIISDLPEKTETNRYCHLTKTQVKLYKQVVKSMEDALENSDGMARRGLVLQSLMRLKQICNHPSQLTGDGEFSPELSGKFLRLTEICEELADRQEKVLVFTQFREIIESLEQHLANIFQRSGLVLHGGTSVKQRKGLVKMFQEKDGPPFFVLSLKAGGTGLTLTEANHVIHFDRWWNPAVENQATDRAFRIGQKRNVLVHKFVTRGTVEERIDTMIAEKQQLANEILTGGEEVKFTELSNEQLLNLVQLDVNRAVI